MNITGSMRQLDETHGAVRVEEVYDVVATELWAAITEPSRLARWIATVEGNLHVGGSFHARFTSSWEGPCRVDVCNAPHHLVVTMQPGTSEETVLEATLEPHDGRTRLVVEERGLPLTELHFHGAGWQAHLEDLSRSLAGNESVWGVRWNQLTPTYQSLEVR